MGVGNGTQECIWQVNTPICVESEDGTTADIHHFECPSVEGPGETRPLILGLRSMSTKHGVLEMRPNHERLSFPGPGGYKIEWSPGTKHFPLTKAPSGHLVIPLGDFGKVRPQAGGLPAQPTTFHATGRTSHPGDCSGEGALVRHEEASSSSSHRR